MAQRDGRAGRCSTCNHPITFDAVFGWLHDDFGPGGRSFDHRATVPPTSDDLSATAATGDGTPVGPAAE